MRVLIAGASLSGWSLAAALARTAPRSGVSITLLSPATSRVPDPWWGALSLTPSASRVCASSLGLDLAALPALAAPIDAFTTRDTNGKDLLRMPAPSAPDYAPYGAPMAMVSHPRLLDALAQCATQAEAQAVELVDGSLVGVAPGPDPGSVTPLVSPDTSLPPDAAFDLVVAADGVRSVLADDEAAPLRDLGFKTVTGLADMTDAATLDAGGASLVLGSGSSWSTRIYPGGGTHWALTFKSSLDMEFDVAADSAAARLAAVLDAAKLGPGTCSATDMVANTPGSRLRVHHLVDRDPTAVASYTVTDPESNAPLAVRIGDAAHPMSAFSGTGAVSALEDAALLARILNDVSAGTASMAQGLALFDSLRIPRCSEFVSRAHTATATSHIRGFMGSFLRNSLLSLAGKGLARSAQSGSSPEPVAEYMYDVDALDLVYPDATSTSTSS